MDLETNATKGLARENSLVIEPGPLPDDARGQDRADLPLRNPRHGRDRLRRDVPRRRRADRSRRAQRPVRAGQLPARGHQEELAHGLRRRRVRQQVRAAGLLPHPAPLRGLHLPALDPAGRARRRPRRRGAEPHQEQLHAQPAGRRDLQRGGVEPAQEEDQEHADPPRRPEHLLRLRRIGHRARTPRRSWRRSPSSAAAPRTPPGRRTRPSALPRSWSSPRTCGSPSTASSRTSSSRTCSASSTTC